MSNAPPPLQYAMILFPGFQLLDVAGPLDVLNLVTLLVPEAKNVSLTIVGETLGTISTKPAAIAKHGMNITCSQSMAVDQTFDEYCRAVIEGDKQCDVLLVPGGFGTRMPSLNQPWASSAQRFIKAIASHVKCAIITVCTGADIVAQTGLLDGRSATTNKGKFQLVADRNPKVKWCRKARWVKSRPDEVQSGLLIDVWTSAGVAAGMDVMLAFVAECFGGVGVARDIAEGLEYEWREVGEGEDDSFYDKYFPGEI